MKPTEAEDTKRYFKYTSRSRLDKAMHTLEGLVCGITADGNATDHELAVLSHWISDHEEYSRFHPFNEIIPRLNQIINDQIVDPEEAADVLWLCRKFTTSEDYYDHVSSDMQRLQGILQGILADNKITKDELETLGDWMGEREHLKRCWPYDEIESLIVAVLADGQIDENEHEELLVFFREFCRGVDGNAIDPVAVQNDGKLGGVCAMCPDVEFPDRTFCFTGSSETKTRKQLAELVKQLGAKHKNAVTRDVDYLVVCNEGNQCWSYACYGRKVEKAIAMRKQGEDIILIHETDFNDAVEDLL